MRRILAATASLLATGLAAHATDFGAGTTGDGWVKRFGLAFDGYYVNQTDNDEGTDENGWNLGGNADFSLGHMGPNHGVQFDLRGTFFPMSHNGDNDWTRAYVTGAAHVLKQVSPATLGGVFGGAGFAEDTGDTDLAQYFWFAGLEAQRTSAQMVTFGQVGYLDGNDEYDEGINAAGFARVGARFFPQPDVSLMAAVSGVFGQQDNGAAPNSSAFIGDLQLEAEHTVHDTANSVFARYEGTLVSFDGGDHSVNFHAFMVGFRWRPDATDLQSSYSGPGSLDLAPVDHWFALTANETE